MTGAGDDNDGTKKNENTKTENVVKDKEENEDGEENVLQGLDMSVKRKLVIVLKKRKHQSSSSESDNVILDATPLNAYLPGSEFGSTQVEPPLKKLRYTTEKENSKTPAKDSDTPAPSRIRFKIIRSKPKPPEPKILLKPHQVTYLRPRPAPKPESADMDDPKSTLMGPPPEPRKTTTPYEMVRDTLTFLKIQLGISLEDYYEMMENESNAAEEYSISRVTPDSLFSMEEVVMELELLLNAIPETASSDVMKQMLLEFQTRLGLSSQPHFYSLMYTSPAHFMNYLYWAQEDKEYDDVDANVGTIEVDDDTMDVNKDGFSTHRTIGHNKALAVEVYQRGETSAFHVSYDHLPPPSLPFYDAIEILHRFVNRIENDEDFVLDETAFLNLQIALMLPDWFSLFELYESQYMDGVVNFIHNYFQTSQMSRFTDNKQP